MLNGVLWNLDWMLTIQDPDDSGVYPDLIFDGAAASLTRLSRYVVRERDRRCIDFAAVMAQASRVQGFRGHSGRAYRAKPSGRTGRMGLGRPDDALPPTEPTCAPAMATKSC